jgi:Icc-related predicted phosphoesterase
MKKTIFILVCVILISSIVEAKSSKWAAIRPWQNHNDKVYAVMGDGDEDWNITMEHLYRQDNFIMDSTVKTIGSAAMLLLLFVWLKKLKRRYLIR